ncbi:hypothetical protein ABPG73_008331 [Tetrahymena malaccensis]
MLKLPIKLYLTTSMVADLDLNDKKTFTTIQEASDQVEIQELFFQMLLQKLSENIVDDIEFKLMDEVTTYFNLNKIKSTDVIQHLKSYINSRQELSIHKENISKLSYSQLSNFNINKRKIISCEKNTSSNKFS